MSEPGPDAAQIRARRQRRQLLTAPAATPASAAAHFLATQAQDFLGGRWALALRSRGGPTLKDLDAAFDRGDLVRTWPLRGTLHIMAPADLRWVLGLTAARQRQQAAGRYRQLGLDAETFDKASSLVERALQGRNRLTRAEIFEILRAGGVDPTGQRGPHLLFELSLRTLICQGQVVPRDAGITREQYFVLVDEYIAESPAPSDPPTELFGRYLAGHAPASAEDFAWWSGLTLTAARQAAAHSVDDDAGAATVTTEINGRPYYDLAAPPESRSSAPPVIALPPFDEYYLAYKDRSHACLDEHRTLVGPTSNGMLHPVLLADGMVVGQWHHPSTAAAAGRAPHIVWFGEPDQGQQDAAAQALRSYTDFLAAHRPAESR